MKNYSWHHFPYGPRSSKSRTRAFHNVGMLPRTIDEQSVGVLKRAALYRKLLLVQHFTKDSKEYNTSLTDTSTHNDV